MLIPNFFGLEFLSILFFVNFLECILKSAVVLFQDRIFSSEIKRILSLKCESEAAMGEAFNALVSVIHTHSNTTSAFVVVDFRLLNCSVISCENNLEFSRLVDDEISGLVLISESMTADNNWFFPARDKPWDVFNDNRLSENSAI